jgi:hypothetical protein
MTRRALGVLVLATLIGVAAGVGIGYLRQPQPAAGGTASPIPAVSPSVPIDPSASPVPYAPDIDYPPLATGLPLTSSLRMSNSLQTWRVPVPRGWVAFTVFDVPVPDKQRSSYDELRFRPPGEPKEGGYSLRVKTVNDHVSTASMVNDKLAGLREAYDDMTVLSQTEDSLKITYRSEGNHLRHNYFQWFAAPGSGEATLEMAVAGRAVDEPGLSDLFAAFASTLQAV